MATKVLTPEISLEEILKYKNQDVIDKILENFDIPEEDAALAFEDLLRWLWVNVEASKCNFEGLVINLDLLIIDEMWHTFILFTKEYTQFCKKYFNYYLHHAPTTKKQKEVSKKEFENNKEAYIKNKKEDMDKVYEFIYDQLGNDVLKRWYLEYPVKYSKQKINSLRRED